MAGMTLTEKIIARAAGLDQVKPEDEVWVTPDKMIMNDTSGPRRIAGLIEELGGLRNPDKVVLASDHFIPASNIRQANILKLTRDWAKDQDLNNFFEYQGVLHNLLLEKWFVLPGMLVVGADSHSVTAGAAGAMAVAVGSTELATVLVTEKVWLRVPQSIHIKLEGNRAQFVDMRDVTMHILQGLKADFALYRAVEFSGSFVDTLSIEERLVLSNQGIEMGAKNAVVVPTEKLLKEISDAAIDLAIEPVYSDPDAAYETVYSYDVSEIEPLVALPHQVDSVVPAAEVRDIKLDAVWIGSCVGGRYEDMRAAAEVLKGKKAQIPLLVNPATNAIYQRCLEEGVLQTLVEASAVIQPAGCGACAGLHSGVVAEGENIITTATRNFRGRMGSRESGVYIASPYTAAASAVAGRVVDPREIVLERV